MVAYGLRTDFMNKLFPGSERLIAIADVIHEVKTVCWCGRKATCNTRYNENGVVRSGSLIAIIMLQCIQMWLHLRTEVL